METLVVEFVFRTCLIAIFTAAVLRVVRIKSARVKHAVWTGVVIVMLALPAWSAWGLRATIHLPRFKETAITPPSIATAQNFTTPHEVPRSNPKPTRSEPTWWPVLSAIYCVGVCILFGRLAAGLMRTRTLVKRAAPREGILTSELGAAPITVGCWKPLVVLPTYGLQLPAAQLDTVLTHENEHARRRDPLVQLLALLNRAVFWFHPLAWWLERGLSTLAEEACDEVVLARGHDPVVYAECLLQIARTVQQAGARVNVLGMAMPGVSLPQRLRRILSGVPFQPVSAARKTCVSAVCIVIAVTFTTGNIGHAQADQPMRPIANSQVQKRPVPLRQEEPPVRHPERKTKVLLASVQPVEPPAAPEFSAPVDVYSISGTVEDPSGGRVPLCVITVEDSTGSVVTSATADGAGVYQIGPLLSGRYALTYSSPGFAPFKKIVDANSSTSVTNAKLTLSQSIATVEVIAPKPANPVSIAAQSVSGQGPIVVGGRVTPMRLLRHPEPIYPQDVRQQGIEGAVLILAVISSDGVPTDLHVVNTAAIDARLVEAALESVRQWRYLPAALNGTPVANVTTISVDFRLYP